MRPARSAHAWALLLTIHQLSASSPTIRGGTGTGASTGGLGSGGWVQDRFVLSFWVDPIVSAAEYDARYAEIAAANFTLVIGGYGALTPKAVDAQLKACEKHGLVALPSLCPTARCADGGFFSCPEALTNTTIDAQSPALWGWMVTDEPSATSPGTPGSPTTAKRPGLNFSSLSTFTGRIRTRRPDKLRYVNLLQNYAGPSYWGVSTCAPPHALCAPDCSADRTTAPPQTRSTCSATSRRSSRRC